MSDRYSKIDLLVDIVVLIVAFPIVGVIVYGLTDLIGPDAIGKIHHLMYRAFASIDLYGSLYRFSWSWETLFIALFGVPYAILVIGVSSAVKRRLTASREFTSTLIVLLRIYVCMVVSFIVTLICKRAVVEIIPDDWMNGSGVAPSRIRWTLITLAYDGVPYTLLCVLVLQSLKKLAKTRRIAIDEQGEPAASTTREASSGR